MAVVVDLLGPRFRGDERMMATDFGFIKVL